MFTVRRVTFSLAAMLLALVAIAAVSLSVFAHHAGDVHPFTLSSSDFKDGKALPASSEYGGGNGCKGQNIAPSFTWENAPTQTRSFALLMNDPDAAVAGGFHHWIVYNIPSNVSSLKGNAPYTEGTTSLNTHAYFGPCPPATGQIHHYTFTLYALDLPNIQTAGLTYDGLIHIIDGHVVGAIVIIGTFSRNPGDN